MRKLFIAAAGIALLTGCTTLNSVFSPSNCASELAAAATLQQIITVIQATGVEHTVAVKIGTALSVGQLAISDACQIARSQVSVQSQTEQNTLNSLGN